VWCDVGGDGSDDVVSAPTSLTSIPTGGKPDTSRKEESQRQLTKLGIFILQIVSGPGEDSVAMRSPLGGDQRRNECLSVWVKEI